MNAEQCEIARLRRMLSALGERFYAGPHGIEWGVREGTALHEIIDNELAEEFGKEFVHE